MPKVSLTKEECYCGIAELYDIIATKLGYNPALVCYDCRKVCVSNPVMEQVFVYFKTEKHISRTAFNQLWLNLGPKANLPGEDYTADTQKGFILEVKS